MSCLDKPKIFVLEDDEMSRECLEEILAIMDFNVSAYENPSKAIIDIENGVIPSIILSDISMPEMNGVDFGIYLKQKGLEIPFIFISAFNDLDYQNSIINNQLNVIKYIRKPVTDYQELIKLIKVNLSLLENENSIKKDIHQKQIIKNIK